MTNQSIEEVRMGDPRVRVLPEPSAVFAEEWLHEVLHPLLTIGVPDEDRTDWIPLLSPIEPESGLLGEETEAHFNDWAGLNWLSFRLDETGRLHFLGDRQLFDPHNPDLAEHYEQANRHFAGTRVRVAREGVLSFGDHTNPEQSRPGWTTDLAIVDQLGGDPGYGNWVDFPPPPALRLDQTDASTPVLRLADGTAFQFVAATSGYPWRDEGADAILVFWEPGSRTVTLTFDWT